MRLSRSGWILGGVAVGVVLIALVVALGGGGGYAVNARFVSASQIVKGNDVRVAGLTVGTVRDVALSDDGQAEITLTRDDGDYAPLRRGTRAIIRQTSLSGVANRYVDLQLGGADGETSPTAAACRHREHRGRRRPRPDLQHVRPRGAHRVSKSVRFLRDFQAGQEDEANAALRQLDPALSYSSRLFAELNRDTPDFQRFIVETSKLVTDVSARDEALSGLVRNLASTTSALTSNGESLGESVGLLPNVLRKSNTTFVDLRALARRPHAARRRRQAGRRATSSSRCSTSCARSRATPARPIARPVGDVVRRKGADNDLVELLRRQPAVDKIANATAERNGEQRPGALPATIKALDGLTPQIGFLRPYAPELVGWFDDFSTSGALRRARQLLARGPRAQRLHDSTRCSALLPVPTGLREELLAAGSKTGRNNRCPGSLERAAPDGSNPVHPVGGLQLRPHPDPDRAMSQVLTCARSSRSCSPSRPGVAVASGTAGAGDEQRYTVVLDNAFGLTEDSDLRSSGVPVGTSSASTCSATRPARSPRSSSRSPTFAGFRKDVFCEVKPQSLIGEYYLDCEPGTSRRARAEDDPRRADRGDDPARRRARHPAPPGPRALRAHPVRARHGARRARRGPQHDDPPRRPRAARDRSASCEILADNRRTLQQLTRDADQVLARRRRATAATSRASSRRPATRPRPPRSAGPSSRRASSACRSSCASCARRCATSARRRSSRRRRSPTCAARAPDLTTLLRRLGPFADSARPAVRGLGEASETGSDAVREARSTVTNLRGLASVSTEPMRNLRFVLEDVNDRERASSPTA